MWLLLALAYPAVFVNLGHGQNGFLTAALFGGALALVDRRPLAAGVLFGLLAYKPQFGLLIPVALVAGGRWRGIAAAALTLAALALATLAAFGPEVWRAYAASTAIARAELLEAGVAGWHKLHSVFAAVRMWGGPIPLAYAVHGAAALVAALSVAWVWRNSASLALRAAALAAATLVAAPHSHDYDLMLLAPAIAFLLIDGFACGFAPYEKTILAFVAMAPLVTRVVAQHTSIPLGTIAIIALLILTVRRAGVTIPHAGANYDAPQHMK
jgi:hypothetical protein